MVKTPIAYPSLALSGFNLISVTGNGVLSYTHTVMVDLTLNFMSCRGTRRWSLAHASEGLSWLHELRWEATPTMAATFPGLCEWRKRAKQQATFFPLCLLTGCDMSRGFQLLSPSLTFELRGRINPLSLELLF